MATNIGERIKKVRVEQKMTLADLSKETNISISYLSQIERDKTTPSLASLAIIAEGLNTNLRYFFEVDNELAYVTRSSVEQPHKSSSQPSEVAALSPVNEPSRLRVWRYNLAPGKHIAGEPEPDSEKFCFVLKGKLSLEIGEETLSLNEGDSVAFDAIHSYTWRNDGEVDCAFIYGCARMKIER